MASDLDLHRLPCQHKKDTVGLNGLIGNKTLSLSLPT